MKRQPVDLDSLRKSLELLAFEMREERERRKRPKFPSTIQRTAGGEYAIDLAGVTTSDGAIDVQKMTSLARDLVDDANSYERDRKILLDQAGRIVEATDLFTKYEEAEDNEEHTITVSTVMLHELIDMVLNDVGVC